MDHTNTLDIVLNEYKDILAQPKLAKAIYRQTGREQRVIVNLDEARVLYELLDNNITSMSNLFEFVQKGLEYVDARERRGCDNLTLTAHAVAQMEIIMKDHGLDKPSWLPVTFREENTQGSHRYQYYFDWSTISPLHIPENESRTIELAIRKYANENGCASASAKAEKGTAGSLAADPTLAQLKKTLPTTPVKSTKLHVASAAPKPKVTPVVVAAATQTESPTLSDRVSRSLVAAKEYLSLFEKAKLAGIPFNLAVDDVMELFRSPTCHFTKEALVVAADESATTPPNQAAIETLDPAKGYVIGNVVVCSIKAQSIKAQVPPEQFASTMQAISVLSASGLDISQLIPSRA